MIAFFFFFKQKTAYEMRISDWSSDVCSSDLPVIEELADQLNGLKAVVAMTDTAHMPESDILAQKLPDLKCYETLIDGEQDSFDWPSFDENTASGLCYTSGTTGDPKGVLYSHRSSVLHAMAITAPDALGQIGRASWRERGCENV